MMQTHSFLLHTIIGTVIIETVFRHIINMHLTWAHGNGLYDINWKVTRCRSFRIDDTSREALGVVVLSRRRTIFESILQFSQPAASPNKINCVGGRSLPLPANGGHGYMDRANIFHFCNLDRWFGHWRVTDCINLNKALALTEPCSSTSTILHEAPTILLPDSANNMDARDAVREVIKFCIASF